MQQLALFRHHLGLSQQAMAILLGVSRATISLVELGRRSLPAEALRQYTRLHTQLPKQLPAAARRRKPTHVRLPKNPKAELAQLRLYLQQKSLQLKMQADLMEEKRSTAVAAKKHLSKALEKPNKKQQKMLQLATDDAATHLERHTEQLVAEYRRMSRLLAAAVGELNH